MSSYRTLQSFSSLLTAFLLTAFFHVTFVTNYQTDNEDFISKKSTVTEESMLAARIHQISAANLDSCHKTQRIVDDLDTFCAVFDNASITPCFGTTQQKDNHHGAKFHFFVQRELTKTAKSLISKFV